MSFLATADAAEDQSLLRRVAACAAGLGISDPTVWAAKSMFTLTSRDGWGPAWAKAQAALPPVTDPAGYISPIGADPDVVTDEMILDGVTAVLAADQQAAETDAAAAQDRTAQLEESLRQTQTQVQLLTEQIAPPPSE